MGVPASLLVVLMLVLSVSACGNEGSEAKAPLGQQLIEAARSGDDSEVRSLLERGADIEARDSTGATALVAAAYGNHIEVARLLVGATSTSKTISLGEGERHTNVVRRLVAATVRA